MIPQKKHTSRTGFHSRGTSNSISRNRASQFSSPSMVPTMLLTPLYLWCIQLPANRQAERRAEMLHKATMCQDVQTFYRLSHAPQRQKQVSVLSVTPTKCFTLQFQSHQQILYIIEDGFRENLGGVNLMHRLVISAEFFLTLASFHKV